MLRAAPKDHQELPVTFETPVTLETEETLPWLPYRQDLDGCARCCARLVGKPTLLVVVPAG